MAYFYLLAAVAVVVWLLAVGCGLVALRFGGQPRRFGAAIALGIVALGIGFLGRNFHLSYSQTVNGRGWRVDSSWFFWAPLVIGIVALALTLWRRWKHPTASACALPPRLGA